MQTDLAQQRPTVVVVLGGGYAGVLAANRLARGGPPSGIRVVLVNASARFCERIRLHEQAAHDGPAGRPLDDLVGGTGVELLVGRALRIDLDRRELDVKTANGLSLLRFDRLVYALGSATDLSTIPGADLHAHTLDGEAGAARLARALSSAQRGAKVAVLGGGLTAIEAAAEIAESHPGLEVTLVTRGEVATSLSEAGRAHVRDVFRRLGVRLLENTLVEEITKLALRTRAGDLPFDTLVVAAGFRASPLAGESGLAVDARGRLLVDDCLRSTSHPFVVGAGDAVGGAVSLRMACATAMPLGAHAADVVLGDLGGDAARPFGFRFLAQCVSLGRNDGLVQPVTADDTPRSWIVRGALAVWLKERICRYTVWSLGRERRAAFRWPRMALRGQRRALA